MNEQKQNSYDEEANCIHCQVENCAHNDGNDHCTAKDVTIKCCNALLGEETMCSTFTEAIED